MPVRKSAKDIFLEAVEKSDSALRASYQEPDSLLDQELAEAEEAQAHTAHK